MQYKTIALELIQEQPGLYERLRTSRTLLATLEQHAIELKAGHEAWKERIGRTNPGGDPSQTASEALELAVQKLRDRLLSASPPDDAGGTPCLDAAMEFLRHHTPRA